MMKGRCWHLPSVLCDCVSSTGLGNSVEEAGGSDGCQELYVIQNTAIDGQLPSSVSMSTQSTESTEIDGPICRICHEGGNRESLLSLCDCRGTLGMVHKSCLEDWLSTSNTSYCELCRTEFSIKRQLRPLTEWQCNEKRRLFCDMVLYLFITVSLAILFWLGLIWALQGLRLGKIPLAAFLIASTFIVFTLYVWWTLVFFRYQFQLYSEWRRTNSKVRLLIPEAKESNSSQHSWLFTKLLKRSVPLRV